MHIRSYFEWPSVLHHHGVPSCHGHGARECIFLIVLFFFPLVLSCWHCIGFGHCYDYFVRMILSLSLVVICSMQWIKGNLFFCEKCSENVFLTDLREQHL